MTGRFGVAAGHPAVAEAAAMILRQGGNAFDAAIAAMAAACVAEPVLASLGGGGFMLAARAGEEPRLIDFFAATPSVTSEGDLDFRDVEADFGPARQTFHIGWGSVAVPGMIPGLFHIHAHYATRDMRRLLAPARKLAEEGVMLRPFDAFLLEVIKPIATASPAACALFCEADGEIRKAGDAYRQPDLAKSLQLLGDQGLEAYSQGPLGAAFLQAMHDKGGLVSADDLAAYEVLERDPLKVRYRDAELTLNTAPSIGGRLIASALQNLTDSAPAMPESAAEALRIAGASKITLEPAGPQALKGTTHISIMDAKGNAATVSLSNGEGMGDFIPGTGIMPNNMLGEADLNPEGFHAWQAGTRLTSMMTPATIAWADGRRVVLGSGGSSRIRSAVLQTALHMIEHERDAKTAVAAPRLHVDERKVDLEQGYACDAKEALEIQGYQVTPWPYGNLYFGGVHAAGLNTEGRFEAAGDPRRGGVGLTV